MTGPTLDLFDRRCPECNGGLTPPSVRCCCARCKHPLDDHSANLDCRTCKAAGRPHQCGINCSPSVLAR